MIWLSADWFGFSFFVFDGVVGIHSLGNELVGDGLQELGLVVLGGDDVGADGLLRLKEMRKGVNVSSARPLKICNVTRNCSSNYQNPHTGD